VAVNTSAISGTGSLTKNGSGLLLLNVSNTYTGVTNISGGTLRLGTTNAIPSTAGVNVNTGTATWDLNGFNNAVGTLSVANGTIIGPGLITLNGSLTSTGNSSISADINLNSAGNRAVSVTNATDSLTLSG